MELNFIPEIVKKNYRMHIIIGGVILLFAICIAYTRCNNENVGLKVAKKKAEQTVIKTNIDDKKAEIQLEADAQKKLIADNIKEAKRIQSTIKKTKHDDTPPKIKSIAADAMLDSLLVAKPD